MSAIDSFMSKVGPMFGNVVMVAFGDDILVGALIGMMDKITPMQCYRYIKENKQLLPDSDISPEDWAKIRQFIRKARLEKLDNERIVKAFQKNRPDLLSVVLNQPGGLEWFSRQLERIRAKLGVQTPV